MKKIETDTHRKMGTTIRRFFPQGRKKISYLIFCILILTCFYIIYQCILYTQNIQIIGTELPPETSRNITVVQPLPVNILVILFLVILFSLTFIFLIKHLRRDEIVEKINPTLEFVLDKKENVVLINDASLDFFQLQGLSTTKRTARIRRLLNEHAPDFRKKTDGKWECSESGKTILFSEHFIPETGNFVFFGTDITDLRSAENQVNRLFTAIEQSANIVVITDTEGVINYVNPAFENITGYTRDEVMGQKPTVLKSGYHDDDFYKELWETISSGKVWNGKFFNKRKNGDTYWEKATITPVSDEKGTIYSYIALKEDISESILLEQNLQKAKETAEQANNLKSRFLANISHEIRTPLTGIIGFADVLLKIEQEQQRDSRNIEMLELIKKSGTTLTELIDEILDLSKIEADKITVNISEFTPQSMMDHLEKQFSIMAAKKSLAIQFVYPSRLPKTLLGDEKKIRQILNNLIGNGLKFTNEGFVLVKTSYKSGIFQVSVEDSGIGISQDQQQVIFDSFYRGQWAQNKEYSGTGLGLTISQRLTELMGGTITVESQLKEGSCFTLRLPLPQSSEEDTLSGGTGKRGEILALLEKWVRNQDNNKDLLRILFKALDKLPGQFIKLEELFNTGDYEGMQPLIHDLKGVAGNIGITEVYELMVQLEREVKKVNPELVQIKNLLSELGKIVQYIPDIDIREQLEITETGNSEMEDNSSSTLLSPILIAEDNEISRFYLKTMLAKEGFSCDIAKDGEEALNMLKEHSYSILLLDMQMPKKNGKKVLQEIRDSTIYGTPCTIAITAYAYQGAEEEFLRLGCDYYLKKPIEIEKLLSLLHSLQPDSIGGKPKTHGFYITDLSQEEQKQLEIQISIIEKLAEREEIDGVLDVAKNISAISDKQEIQSMAKQLRDIWELIDFPALGHFINNAVKPETENCRKQQQEQGSNDKTNDTNSR